MDIITDLLTNIIILFGLLFIVSLSSKDFIQKNFIGKVFVGLIIGFSTIIIMINAWVMSSGAIFDTRSVLISVTALFFPLETSLTASIIAIIYRIQIGGDGVYAGVLTILFSFLIGVFWRKHIFYKSKLNKVITLYIFGVVVHISMILCQLAFPYPLNLQVIKLVSPIVIIAYPIAVTCLSLGIIIHKNRLDSDKELKKSEEKYRTLIENSKLGIIQYDTNGIIELANEEFANILGTEHKNLIGLNINELPNKDVVEALNKSLNGSTSIFNDYYESIFSKKKFPTRVQFSPILIENKIIGGIALIEDLTEQTNLKKSVEELSNRDILTKLYNRTAFDLFLYSKDEKLQYPVSISTCGINKFTIVNTSFGYDVGNQVLVEIAKLLLEYEAKNTYFRAYRIGGDQFALVMPKTPNDVAEIEIENLKQKINSIEKFKFDINISCGLATAENINDSIIDIFTKAFDNKVKAKVYEGSSISTKTVDLIMNTLFAKNERENLHSERVSKIAREIAELYNLGTAFCNRVELAGKLHDIGKITVSEEILDKPGKLNNTEWEKIKKHPETGFMILSSVKEYLDFAHIVYSHHERWDGFGYPRGLSKNNSPLEARIIGVADAYDAMTVSRPYRRALTPKEAIDEIEKYSGTQFDPEVAEKIITLYNSNKL